LKLPPLRIDPSLTNSPWSAHDATRRTFCQMVRLRCSGRISKCSSYLTHRSRSVSWSFQGPSSHSMFTSGRHAVLVISCCADLLALTQLCCLWPGIECPRSSRNMPGGVQVAEPFSDEAMLFTKELVLQREVSGAAGRPSAPSVRSHAAVSWGSAVSETTLLLFLFSHCHSKCCSAA